ncbi:MULTISPECIES: PD-(D/E)XK nuclease family protein [Acidobacteriaceae]|uniref:PD-(D/E)XK nuclease family protein n=1 Tax=Acidobacteriaceae TaxID=204434 RepID=UPI00131CA032|nr:MULTISPECIES: PD-(D/E)XK nuclease family protein [Acidobacteriaceae]MDW5266279.1 PD-(D/E)XK nuclease family protein [Edaphobacter sp.]
MLPVEIAQALERGAAIVTGNQRAARTLRVAFDRRQRSLGRDSWQPPVIMAWDAWTADLWHVLLIGGHTSKLLLNRAQEHAVWQNILEADAELRSLRAIDSLADMAAQAWSLLCSYNGHARLRGAAVSSDTRAFHRWALKFEQQCRADGLLARAQLESALQAAASAGQLEVKTTSEIVLVGFDSMTPAQLRLADALRGAGVNIEELPITIVPEQQLIVTTADERKELRIVALGVRKMLEQHPHSRVAVIVPDLEKQRAEIDRVFREILAPELEDITANANSGPFEFSVGVMLADTPMAATALDLLRWCTGALPLERVSRLLLSPYLAAIKTEYGARAEFDAFDLRRAKLLRPEISLEWLMRAMEGSRRKSKLTGLLNNLRMMQIVVNRLAKNAQRSHSEWAEAMRELLSAVAWGAGKGEDSVEFQTRRKWESALDELSTLDFDGQGVGFEQALDALARIAQQTMFAPESREAPVQIMGPLEAAGSTFDVIWFMRSGDLSWPLPRSANPLLPWPLQRDLEMPGTDAQQDANRSQRITERIAASASTVVFSYAAESPEGRQRLSSAMNGLALDPVAIEEITAAEAKPMFVETEKIEDRTRLQPLPDQVIHGGAEILRLQAACGFRAFAERRLWSTELRTTEMGLDAAERGTIVHLVLEKFWNEVKTQSALKAMQRSEREALLNQCIATALEKSEKLSETAWDAAYLDMQRERLRNLLGPWLELELTRPPFTVKLSEKELKGVQIGPLRLSVRVDRVDIGEGGDIIIDYKTGVAKPSEWLTDRPEAPQLPLYAVLSAAEQLEAVAFGQVRAGKDMGLQGFATSSNAGIRVPRQHPADLEQQVEEWRQVLTSLAEDFYNGDIRVRPKNFPSTCTYCAQRLLCRVDPASFEQDDDEEATEAERD